MDKFRRNDKVYKLKCNLSLHQIEHLHNAVALQMYLPDDGLLKTETCSKNISYLHVLLIVVS